MKFARVVAAGAAALMLSSLGVSASQAEDTGDDGTIVVDGQVFGPEDGLEVHYESLPVPSDGTDVGSTWGISPDDAARAAWGSSFAYSTEVLQLEYVGRGKAGGNVFNNQRIIRVCFYWTRGTHTSSTYCGDAAYSDGRWSPGAEFVGSWRDSLNPVAPTTVFHPYYYTVPPVG